MTYGVVFDALRRFADNTLTNYGLLLVDDVVLSSPELKTNYIDVPGMDGSIDASEAPQGYPVYQDRTLSFSLYADVDDEALAAIRTELMTKYHGKRTTLGMPFETGHYFSGRFQFGALDSSKRGIIPVSGTVYPYVLEIGRWLILTDMTTEYQTMQLMNEGRAVVPIINVAANTVVKYMGEEYELTVAEEGVGQDFMLSALLVPGSDDGTPKETAVWQVKLKAESDYSSMSVEYQRGHL